MFAFLVFAEVGWDPNPFKVPGGAQLQQLLDGLGGIAFMVCLAGLAIGVMIMAVGKHGNNPRYESSGRTAAVASGGGAFLLGAGPAIINWLHTLGAQIK